MGIEGLSAKAIFSKMANATNFCWVLGILCLIHPTGNNNREARSTSDVPFFIDMQQKNEWSDWETLNNAR